MSAKDGMWDTSPATFHQSRIFEYTSNNLKAQFAMLEKPGIDEMTNLPCLFAYEAVTHLDARIGRITEFRKRNSEVRICFEIDKSLPTIGTSAIERLLWELDIEDFELNRTHWALKDVNLLRVLFIAGVLSEDNMKKSYFKDYHIVEDEPNTIVFPSVFRIPEGNIETDLVSVMRPFNSNFKDVQTMLAQACECLELRCHDVNEFWNESEIFQDVFSLIFRSKVVICDFSDRNPNVFYETGIAHTLGRQVIPIVQNPEHIPFDLRQHRYIEYLNNSEGLSKLKIDVTKRLKTLFNL